MNDTLPVTAFGWMRRPELDVPYAVAWETPAGVRILVPDGWTPRAERIGDWTMASIRKAGVAGRRMTGVQGEWC